MCAKSNAPAADINITSDAMPCRTCAVPDKIKPPGTKPGGDTRLGD
jgi:hypothetical protein